MPVPTEEATHEAWTLMAAFAATTSRIRLGQMCTCIAYRNPAYLAKVAATVDIISGGRLEMGIGAGWYEHEWRAYGYGFPDAPDRLRMLREGVEIMHQAWTHRHRHARRRVLPGRRRDRAAAAAAGRRHPDVGRRRRREGDAKIAAQYAQYTNFNGGAEVFAAKSELLRGHCETVGTDFDAIVRSSNFNTIIGSTEAEVQSRIDAIEARLHAARASRRPAQYVAAVPAVRDGEALIGTPEQIIEMLQRAPRAGSRLQHPLLPGVGLRPLGRRALRARGHAAPRLTEPGGRVRVRMVVADAGSPNSTIGYSTRSARSPSGTPAARRRRGRP